MNEKLRYSGGEMENPGALKRFLGVFIYMKRWRTK
jgi:hypothetical protein